MFALLAVVLAIAGGALWYVKKKYPALAVARVQGTRVQILETRRIAPKLVVSLLEVDGNKVLLTQSGDRVSSLLLPADNGNTQKVAE